MNFRQVLLTTALCVAGVFAGSKNAMAQSASDTNKVGNSMQSFSTMSSVKSGDGMPGWAVNYVIRHHIDDVPGQDAHFDRNPLWDKRIPDNYNNVLKVAINPITHKPEKAAYAFHAVEDGLAANKSVEYDMMVYDFTTRELTYLQGLTFEQRTSFNQPLSANAPGVIRQNAQHTSVVDLHKPEYRDAFGPLVKVMTVEANRMMDPKYQKQLKEKEWMLFDMVVNGQREIGRAQAGCWSDQLNCATQAMVENFRKMTTTAVPMIAPPEVILIQPE